MIAVVGASITRQHVSGYYLTPTNAGAFWPIHAGPAEAYGGGTLRMWSDPASAYWQSFDANLALHGAATVWWNLLIKPEEMTDTLVMQQAQAGAVITALRARTMAPIVVSPSGCYLPITSSNSAPVQRSVQLAFTLARDGKVEKLGPQTGPWSPEHYISPSDPHLTAGGIVLAGRQMVAFFG